MARLILTFSDSGAGALKRARPADCVIGFGLRFVLGKLQSPRELDMLLSQRSAIHPASASHWLDNLDDRSLEDARVHGLGLPQFCESFEAVELWIDPEPNAQLILVWLLDYLRPHEKVVSKLRLVQADAMIGDHTSTQVTEWQGSANKIRSHHLEIASAAWQAYRAPTPQAWSDLLGKDLSVLPQLGNTVLQLLEELPGRASGLGATEMRMLELVSEGHMHPYDLFPGEGKPNRRRVFGYWEVGSLLDGLARCPAPAVFGLDEGPFTLAMHEDGDRHARYKKSRLSLTELGKAILAQTDDFSRRNPLHRWWGGTELTPDVWSGRALQVVSPSWR
jgi:hypothetical protein